MSASQHKTDCLFDHARDDFMLSVSTAMTMGELQTRLKEAGQAFALVYPEQLTLKTVLDLDLPSSTSLQFGLPHDWLLWSEALTADQQVAHSGAKVVKNATGYDLNKLYCGSYGTLVSLSTVTLKLIPLSTLPTLSREQHDVMSHFWDLTQPGWNRLTVCTIPTQVQAYEEALLHALHQLGGTPACIQVVPEKGWLHLSVFSNQLMMAFLPILRLFSGQKETFIRVWQASDDLVSELAPLNLPNDSTLLDLMCSLKHQFDPENRFTHSLFVLPSNGIVEGLL